MTARAYRARLHDALFYGIQALVTTLLAVRVLGLWGRPFSVPMIYRGDALAGGSQIKATVENGWYENNPLLGAPEGQTLHDFPMADNMQFVTARVLGFFTDQWGAVYNASYLLTFPLSAVAAAWFLRVVGVRRTTAFVVGILYAFTPYHFIHGISHLALSMIYVVPLFAVLVVKVLDGRPIWGRRPDRSWWDPRAHLTGATLGTLAILAVTGSTSSYYAVFGLMLMALAIVVQIVRKDRGAAVAGVVAAGLLVAVMLSNMLPDILYQRSAGVSPAEFARSPVDSEVYALKLSGLLLPVSWHRIGPLAEIRTTYDADFPLPSEGHPLGIVAAVGLLILFVVAAARLARAGSLGERIGNAQAHLALLTVAAFLWGTVGGFGTLFAIFVTPDIRGWNRIVAYIALFCLASVALLLDAALARLALRRPGIGIRANRAIAAAAAGALGLIGIYDGVPPAAFSTDASAVSSWNNDAAYVRSIEARMPKGARIFELPVMPFPENGPIGRMLDYEPIRPYLHSDELAWSYGGVKGRPRADWQQSLAGLSTPQLLTVLAATGFGGIHLDRSGYSRKAFATTVASMATALGTPITSPGGRFVFFDLRDFAERLRSTYQPEEWSEIADRALRAPASYWQQSFNPPGPPDRQGRLVLVADEPDPTIVVDNPRAPTLVRFHFRMIAPGGAGRYELRWPDGSRQAVRVGRSGATLTRDVVVPRGRSAVRIDDSVDALNVALKEFSMRDPEVSTLVPRGPAAQIPGAAARADEESAGD